MNQNRIPKTHLSVEQKAIIGKVREETGLGVLHHFYEFTVWIRGVNTDRYMRFYSNMNPGSSTCEHYLKREGIQIPSKKGKNMFKVV